MSRPEQSFKGLLPKTAFVMTRAQKISNQGPDPVEGAGLSFSSLEKLEIAYSSEVIESFSPGARMIAGEGNPGSAILFISENASSADEANARPFSGDVGALLEKMIEAMGLKRQDVFLTSLFQHYFTGNAEKKAELIDASLPYFDNVIQIVQPKMVVLLGERLARDLIGVEDDFARIHGNIYSLDGVSYLPTFHPAFLLENPGAKKDAWEDLKQVMKALGLKGK